MSPLGTKACPFCRQLFRLAVAGNFPEHGTGTRPDRQCIGAGRSPTSAKALARSRAVVGERKAAKQ